MVEDRNFEFTTFGPRRHWPWMEDLARTLAWMFAIVLPFAQVLLEGW